VCRECSGAGMPLLAKQPRVGRGRLRPEAKTHKRLPRRGMSSFFQWRTFWQAASGMLPQPNEILQVR